MPNVQEKVVASGALILREVGRTGWIHLNRPSALNALNFEMILGLTDCLQAWEKNETIQQIVLTGEGRAFCAGGDIRDFYEARRQEKWLYIEDYFRAEYRLNTLVFSYPKPYISLLHGTTMGGGMGLTIPGHVRVVHPDAQLAMPEVSIGLFPDVGGTYFLQKCPGMIGRYLSLTGNVITGADALYAGLVTHMVAADQWSDLVERLTQGNESYVDLLDAISLRESPPGLLQEKQAVIDSAFQYETIEEILAACDASPDPWTRELCPIILSRSPLSLKVTLAHQLRAKGLSFRQCMAHEFSLSQAFARDHDFPEGVRARIIDKDQCPHWQPESLEKVSEKQLQGYLMPFHKNLF